jgi:hypothetical protein
MCQCSTEYYYFSLESSSCIQQGNYSAACSADNHCRVDRYLACYNGACSCISPKPIWSNGFNKCIVPGTYNNTCYATSDCSVNESLVCSNGTSCLCPTNLPAGKCDCPIRVNTLEMFWNGLTCTSALNNSQSCSENYTAKNNKCLGLF